MTLAATSAWDAYPVVVVAAPIGAEVNRDDHPAVPFTAEEVIADVVACCEAGASAIHLHLREDDGSPSVSAERYRYVIGALRRETDAVLMVSTGGGAGMTLAERMAGICAEADVVGIETGSVNFGDYVFATTRSQTLEIAAAAGLHGLRLEVEAFDLGHVGAARRLVGEGHLRDPLWNLVFGAGDGIAANPESLAAMRAQLPPGACWTVTGIGRHQRRMNALGLLSGATAIRVGLEDNVYRERGTLARDNADLVEAAVELARSLGREPASTEFARARLLGGERDADQPAP